MCKYNLTSTYTTNQFWLFVYQPPVRVQCCTTYTQHSFFRINFVSSLYLIRSSGTLIKIAIGWLLSLCANKSVAIPPNTRRTLRSSAFRLSLRAALKFFNFFLLFCDIESTRDEVFFFLLLTLITNLNGLWLHLFIQWTHFVRNCISLELTLWRIIVNVMKMLIYLTRFLSVIERKKESFKTSDYAIRDSVASGKFKV